MTEHSASRASIGEAALREVRRHLAAASRLLNLTVRGAWPAREFGPILDLPHEADDPILGRLARVLIRERSLRRAIIDDCNLLGEPAWDLLLDLFAAQVEGLTVGVSSACIAAGVPQSTALRYISKLVSGGVIVRTPHGDDERCINLSLSEETMERMRAYLRRAASLRSVLP